MRLKFVHTCKLQNGSKVVWGVNQDNGGPGTIKQCPFCLERVAPQEADSDKIKYSKISDPKQFPE
jgi:hypothetical protein